MVKYDSDLCDVPISMLLVRFSYLFLAQCDYLAGSVKYLIGMGYVDWLHEQQFSH